MRDRTACPRTSSNARNHESRVGGSRQRIPPTPRVRRERPRVARIALEISRWKSRGRGDSRLETGIAKPLPGVRTERRSHRSVHLGKAPVRRFTAARRPDLTTKQSKSGRPLEAGFARRALEDHHEWWREPAGPTRYPPRAVHEEENEREPQGPRSDESFDSAEFMGADEHLSFAD